jgi:AcrR family transcriptional regulator
MTAGAVPNDLLHTPRARVASGAMSRESNTADRRRERRDIPAAIIAAARQNFLHYGVNRTTMADIARAVGMPRQTLYEYVSSRDDLVDSVLVARIKEIAEDLKPLAAEGVPFADAMVETSVAAIERARNDRELMNIFTTGPNDRVQAVVIGPYPEIHDIVVDLLGPILDQAAASNILRTDKTRDEIIDWVRIVYLSLITQPAAGQNNERAIVADFLLPSIMFSKDDKRPRDSHR